MPATQPAGVDRAFHALSDPTRRAILDRLSHGPHSVSRLAAPLSITLTAVSQHLQILEDSGFVRTEKSGRIRTCRIDPAGFTAIERWIGYHRSLWEQKLDRLGELLRDEEDDGKQL